MKKFFVFFALFSALIFVISCGGGSKTGDTTDTGETVTDEDSADSEPEDSELSGDTDSEDPANPDTTPDNGDTTPDGGDTTPDNGDTTPDNGDTTPDGGDTIPDGGDTEPDNDYPQTPCNPNPCISDANSTGVCTIKNNSYVCGCKSGYIFDGTLCIKSLPECSPTSETPCFDSATGLIWSAKSENKMPWNDAVNYCQNLTEGDFNDWRLPSIAVLKTLVQNCSSAKCADDYTGKYSKFADTVYLWSSSDKGSAAYSIYFSDASTQSVSIDDNVNVRCVRRETESRESNCTGLIENSVWNTATQITQIWDWETAGWTPSSESSYNTNGSTSECRFKCDTSSFWDGSSKCSNLCKPNPCTKTGETGVCVGKSANEYICECEDKYLWDSSSKQCLNPCEPNPCNTIGETGICLSKSANEYTCECEDNYFWVASSNKCMKNPCQNNPCNIPNSTGICNPISETKYICECEENYVWWEYSNSSNSNKCIEPPECGKSSGAPCYDSKSGLTWSRIASNTSWVWYDAVDYCNSLSQGGLSGWHLPTISELRTLIKNCGGTVTGGSCGVTDSCLSSSCATNSCDSCSYDSSGKYSKFGDNKSLWSSSTLSDNTNRAWGVWFSDGGVGTYSKSYTDGNNYVVRCVR